MKNGTSTAILVTELLTAEGPYTRAADDFIDASCTRCGALDNDALRLIADELVCGGCARQTVRSEFA